jgi:hypothetical protein
VKARLMMRDLRDEWDRGFQAGLRGEVGKTAIVTQSNVLAWTAAMRGAFDAGQRAGWSERERIVGLLSADQVTDAVLAMITARGGAS